MSALTHGWEYGRRELPYLAQALMELSLFVPFCLVFMPWASYWSIPQFFFLLLCILLIPFNLIRLMSLWGVSLSQQRTTLLIGLFITIFICMRTLLYEPTSLFDVRWIRDFFVHIRSSGYPFWARDFIVLGMVIYLWWRGIRLIDRSRDIDMIGLQFRVRALLFAPLVIYLATSRLAWSITPFIILFCFTSLILIALARAEQVEEQASGMSFSVTPGWIGIISLAGISIVALGLLLASSTTSESVFGPPQTAARLATHTVFYTFINLTGPTFFWLFEHLSAILEFILAPIARALANLQISLPQSVNLGQGSGEMQPVSGFLINATQLAVTVTAVIFIVAVVALVLLGLMASVRTLQNLQHRPDVLRPPRESEDAIEEEGLWQRLRNLIPRLRDWRTAASIRRIYRQMVYAATAAGYPRHVTETPYEYLSRLQQLWADNVTETTLITNAYVRVHYGELPETRAELDEIYKAWQNLERNIRQVETTM